MKTITQHLITSILITVLVVFGGWGYWDLRTMLVQEQASQDYSLRNIAERTAIGLENSLWNLNLEGIRKLIHSVVLDEALRAAIVYDETEILLAGEIRERAVDSEGKQFNQAAMLHRQVIERNSPPEITEISHNGKRIGKLLLYANKEQLLSKLQRQKMAFFGKLIFLVVVLSLVLFLILRRVVVRPTMLLKEWVVSYNPEQPRPLPELRKSYELSVLAQAFAGMAKRLADSRNELEISNKLLRSVLDNSFQLQGLLSPEGKVIDVNATALTMINASRDEVLDRYFWDTPWWNASSETAETIRKAVARAAKGELVRFETQHRDTQGELHDMDFSLNPVLGDDGAVLFLIPEGRDITERRQLEQERVANSTRQRFQQLVENANDTIFTLSLSGVLTYISPNCKEFLGYTAEEITGKKIEEIVHPDDIEACLGFIREILANGRKSGAEYRVLLKNGGISYHSANGSLQSDIETGEQTIFCIARDITRHREIEEELRESEQRFRIAMENSGDAIFIADRQGNCTYCNKAATDMLGYDRAELMQFAILDITPPERRGQYQGLIREIVSLGRAFREIELVTKSGNRISVDLSAVMLPNGSVFASCRDISERKLAEDVLRESQRRLADIVNFLPLATMVIDNEKKVTAWNRAMEEITGVRAEDMLGKGDYEYALPFYGERRPIVIDLVFEDEEMIAKKYQHVVRSGQILSAEAFIPKIGTEGIILVAFASPLYDADGNVIGAIESIHDVTEIRRTEAELNKAKEAADAANRAKSAFLANMSHEIRTPMNAILGFAQLMHRDQSLSSLSRDHLNIINRSGEYLLALINDILEISKIEAGHAIVNAATFDLHKLIEDLDVMFRVRTDTKKLRLLVEIRDQVPRWVIGDEGKLRQILVNILGNAVKFTEEGGISLRIGAAGNSASEVYDLHFEVEDTGPGIPEAELEKLFKIFEQTSSGVKKGGTGLGLALVKGFIQMMNGEIEVHSRVGEGSLFSFALPMRSGSKEQLQQKEITKRIMGLAPAQEDIRVLVVDDVETNRLLLSQMLAAAGFAVAEAADGKEAVAKFREWKPRIILMDMSMPVMDGYEAIRLIRESGEGRQTVIIAITASAFREDRQKIVETGADGYLSKPFKEFDLLETIGRLSGVSYLYDENIPDEGSDESLQDSTWGEQLHVLPSGLVKKCREAAENADIFELQKRIADISSENPLLAKRLMKLADDFDYDRIDDLLTG